MHLNEKVRLISFINYKTLLRNTNIELPILLDSKLHHINFFIFCVIKKGKQTTIEIAERVII